ncbi:hypothetical protein Leryth_025442 [Lithospermum erythrorhizon]|nr:hypothetical protein Leryth_025442 [Lithospermum erythrorhizon]
MMILYTMAMADYDQDNGDVYKDLLSTKNGINCLGLYPRDLAGLRMPVVCPHKQGLSVPIKAPWR